MADKIPVTFSEGMFKSPHGELYFVEEVDQLVVEDIFVDAEHRRSGEGTALINALKEYAKQKGFRIKLIAAPTDDMDISQIMDFYLKMGFRVTGFVPGRGQVYMKF